MVRRLLQWVETHEKHLSALAMLAGFVVDNLFFTRVDLWQTQVVFLGYTVACFISIPLLHWIETRSERSGVKPRWRVFLPIVTQFALGGFWSGFVIFYGRSAVLGVSWPFIIFLVLVFLGSEYFHQYHARLVFTSVLFFIALYLYAIFALPVYTGTIDMTTFFESGVLALLVFALFTILLRLLAHERFLVDVSRIRIGALIVTILINVSYLVNILPPLPLSAEAAGVYHSVWRVPGAYLAQTESEQSWQVKYLGFSPTLHVVSGESIYAYSSIFAPTTLMTTIVHRWQWYDRELNTWVTRSKITYPIVGGRDGGYRGYSAVPVSSGKWRVSVETSDGRVISRLPFNVEYVAQKSPQETITLK